MRVRMLHHIGGTRNGDEWPAIGGEIDVPDYEAADLILAGYAEDPSASSTPEPVATPEPEPDAPADPEPAEEPEPEPKPKPRRARAAVKK